jgi:hypothetical protein
LNWPRNRFGMWHPSGEACPVLATFEREVRPRGDPRKEG